MASTLKSKSQVILIASMFVASCARKTFLPNNGYTYGGVQIQNHNNVKSISEAIMKIRGGSDRGYDYNDGHGRDDDYSRGYEYGDGNVGSGRYDYEDDRYADDGRGADDYHGADRDRSRDRDDSSSVSFNFMTKGTRTRTVVMLNTIHVRVAGKKKII